MNLENRIKTWIKDNPDRAYAGNRMLSQLERVRKEFTGLDAIRLEGLVAETLDRQLGIDASRAQHLEDATKLAESIQNLKDGLVDAQKNVKKLPVVAQGIEAAAHKITTRNLKPEKALNKDLSFVPDVPKIVDKNLN